MGVSFSNDNYPAHVSDSEDEHEYGLPLHDAVFDDDCDKISELIRNGHYVNTCNPQDETALFVAATHGNASALKLLLDNSADPDLANENGVTPLHKAVRCYHEECIEILLESNANANLGDSTGWSPLHEACYRDFPLAVEQLIKIGSANVNIFISEDKITPLFTACQYGSKQCVEMLLAHDADSNLTTVHGDSPLHIACQQGQVQCIELIIRDGFDINSCNNTGLSPLAMCCRHNQYVCAKTLLDYGARIVPLFPNADTITSPLHSAASQNETDCLQLLLDSIQDHKDLDCLCDNVTALFTTVVCRAVQNCRMLLTAGANPNSICTLDEFPTTPLLAAAENNYIESLVALIEGGADVNLMTNTSPLIGAIKTRSTECIEYLLNHPTIDINLVDGDNNTALSALCSDLCRDNPQDRDFLQSDYAVSPTSEYSFCRKMLCMGADISQVYSSGSDYINSHIMDFPSISHHPELMELLLEYETDETRLPARRICEANKDKEQWKSLYEMTRSPRRLKHLCRLLIRRTFGHGKLDQIDDLPLPNSLKMYLSY